MHLSCCCCCQVASVVSDSVQPQLSGTNAVSLFTFLQSPSSSAIAVVGGSICRIAGWGAIIHIWRPEITYGCDISCLLIWQEIFSHKKQLAPSSRDLPVSLNQARGDPSGMPAPVSCSTIWVPFLQPLSTSREASFRLHVGTVSLICFSLPLLSEWPASENPAPLPDC